MIRTLTRDKTGTGQQEVTHLPRGPLRSRRPVVFCHGSQQTALTMTDLVNHPDQVEFLDNLAYCGFGVISGDLAGNNWGNDTALARVDACRTYMATLGFASDKIILIGVSMGSTTALNYARANPTRVACYIGLEPAMAVNAIRDGANATTRDVINTAWGMPLGSTSTTNPLPTRADPTTAANIATIQTTPAFKSGLMVHYYSTGDTFATPAMTKGYADAVGFPAVSVSSTINHTDDFFGAVPLGDVLELIAAAA